MLCLWSGLLGGYRGGAFQGRVITLGDLDPCLPGFPAFWKVEGQGECYAFRPRSEGGPGVAGEEV